jgi:hypothetical protein
MVGDVVHGYYLIKHRNLEEHRHVVEYSSDVYSHSNAMSSMTDGPLCSCGANSPRCQRRNRLFLRWFEDMKHIADLP